MERITGVLQVNSVTPGSIGGAVFSGRIIGKRRVIVCRAHYQKITRIPRPGECWHINGLASSHDEYRHFISIEHCHLVPPPEAGHIRNFLLKHPDFRGFGFGIKKVNTLIDAFGASALITALDNRKVNHLSEVVNPSLAEKLVDTWSNLSNETETVSFLVENQIPIELVKPILKACSFDTVNRLKTNPYVLVAFSNIVPNIWNDLDSLSIKLGIVKDDSRRLVGAIELSLYKELEKGNTASTVASLKYSFAALTKAPHLFDVAIKAAFSAFVACSIERNGNILIQPIGAAIIEQDVESKISEMAHTPHQPDLINNIEVSTKHYGTTFQKLYGFTLNRDQMEAVKTALSNKISVITGFGGTGKTTVLRAIVELEDHPVYVLALSGKAKERAREATEVDAYTIHTFIRLVKNRKLDIIGNPRLIIDEASMVDISLINQLLKVMGNNEFSLVMVGDTGQLSPVGFGLFWHSLARSKNIPVAHLTEVHRTSSDQLHEAAMSIRAGSLNAIPSWNGEAKGIYFVECPANQKELCRTLLTIHKTVHPDHQIITPYMHDGAVESGNAINYAIQINMHPEERQGLHMGSFWLRQGDPVIVTSNSYERDLFNGNIGCLVEIDTKDEQAIGIFDFYGTTHYLTVTECWDLGIRLAYAISIHKSQGSEYDTSIVCVVSDTEMIERSMLYTATTRSKNLTILVGSRDIARRAAARLNRAETLCVGFNPDL